METQSFVVSDFVVLVSFAVGEAKVGEAKRVYSPDNADTRCKDLALGQDVAGSSIV